MVSPVKSAQQTATCFQRSTQSGLFIHGSNLNIVRQIFYHEDNRYLCGHGDLFLSGCAMLIRESHVDDKTYRKFSALAQQQLPTTKHPLIGIYVLELEADQETIKPEDGRKPLYEGVKIAAVHNDSKIEFVSLSSLKIDSYDLIPDQDAFLQGITLWEVPISPFMHTNTWKGIRNRYMGWYARE